MVDLHIQFSEESECFPQVLHMIGAIKTLYKHVIDVYLYCVPNQLLESLIDHSLENGSDVLQAEGYDFVSVDGAAIDKDRLVLIWRMHLDLIVSRVGIHEALKFMACYHVDHLVYVGQREDVFGAGHV